MPIPKTFYKVTKSKNPKYKLYQPGYMRTCSCWLEGDWIDLSKEEWEKRRDAHQEMYSHVRAESKTQSISGSSKEVSELTPAEKQAYEHFSGYQILTCVSDGGGPAYFETILMAGDKAQDSEIRRFSTRKLKIVAQVQNPDGSIVDQRGFGFPEENILVTEKPLDINGYQLEFNRKRRLEKFGELFQKKSMNGFWLRLMSEYLIDQETSIIIEEYRLSLGLQANKYFDLDGARKDYAWMRSKLVDPNLVVIYTGIKKETNLVRREVLEEHEYLIGEFVLPPFNEDGTHDPWGPKDVPNEEFMRKYYV